MNNRKRILSILLCLLFVLCSFNNTVAFAAKTKNTTSSSEIKGMLPLDLIPEKAGNMKSYMSYKAVTLKNSPQYAICRGGTYKGKTFKTITDPETGVREVDGCYCVALGTFFTKGEYQGCNLGSKFRVTTSEGNQFTVIWADYKADKDTDGALHLYMKNDLSIIEFVVDTSVADKRTLKVTGDFSDIKKFKGRVIALEKLDSDAIGTTGAINISGSYSSSDSPFIENAPIAGIFAAKLLGLGYDFKSSETGNIMSDIKKSKAIQKIKKLVSRKTSNGTIQTKDNLKTAKSKISDSSGDSGSYQFENVGNLKWGNPDGTEGSTGYMQSPVQNLSYSVHRDDMRYASGTWHAGVDIVASTGTNVYAADGGIVIRQENKDANGNWVSYGLCLKIKCTDPSTGRAYWMYYAHLSETCVVSGQIVKKGDLIARSGNTGHSTGPHLHFEVRVDNSYSSVIDPYYFFDKDRTYFGAPIIRQ